MKTITVATARKIAKDHGLTFDYNRSANVYVLSNQASNKISFMPKVLTLARYEKKDLDSVTVDDFYLVCMNVAANTINKEQMDKVVIRARFMQANDDFLNNPESAYKGGNLDAYSDDKIVHNMEDAIYGMHEELESVHGSYADHKAACIARIEELTIEMQGEIPDGTTWEGTDQMTELNALQSASLYTVEYEACIATRSLTIRVIPGTNLDSRFKAWDTEANEFIIMNGWLWEFAKGGV